MNFFDAQDRAKKTTRWLVFVYLLSTVLIVAGVTTIVGAALYQGGSQVNSSLLLGVAAVTALFILGASTFRTMALAGGGGKVAQSMGGTPVSADVQDPLRRRLRNVVEEMAIASGVPVPDLYVLESESGINAFAAGFTPGDAAIAVTRGAIETLNREELQGVIAHEFSHILNGDMRLNIRMMGVLFGILVIGLIGRIVLRGGSRGSLISSRRSRNAGAVMMIGLGLTLLGWIGVFFARLIKAAVSRQRELLADASAVQFTRQTSGLANALKKIGGYSRHSYFEASDPEEVSHMLFADGLHGIARLFATHPPLIERIRALEPDFQPEDYPHVDATAAIGAGPDEGRAAGFAGSVAPPAGHTVIEGGIAESIGRPTPEQVGFARQLHRSIPEELYAAAHAPEGAYLLTVALVLDPPHLDRQLGIVENRLGADRALTVKSYYHALESVGAAYRLPLLEIAFPALKQRPQPNLQYLLDLVRRLIELDGEIDLREFCYYRIIARHLEQAMAPSRHQQYNKAPKSAARRAALELLRIVAEKGNEQPGEIESAFRAGSAVFGDWAHDTDVGEPGARTVERLDEALDILSKLNPAGRRSMIEAVAATIADDGRLTATEGELLRAVCASLDCPVPPIPGASASQ